MERQINLGRIAGLSLSMLRSAFSSYLMLWLILSLAGYVLLFFPLGQAFLGGLIAIFMHWASELFHQFGHAWAARGTGYPMTGVRFWSIFASSLYPPDEPELGASVHVKRALGGPVASFALSLTAALLALVIGKPGGFGWWLILFLCLDNLVVFTLGSLLPLGFTDGSTLLRWLGKE